VDAPRPGAARTIGDDVIEAVVVETLESAPPDATHWSTRGLAAKHGISHQTVAEIWREAPDPGVEPPRPDAADVAHHPQRATHHYERNGTCDLFAALNMTTASVITDIRKSHTSADFIAFLNRVNREVPKDLDVHVILD